MNDRSDHPSATAGTPTQLPEEALSSDSCPVHSHNEWDPLEEVIVGRLEGATIPSNHVTVTFNVPPKLAKLYGFFAGRRYPRILTKAAQQDLDGFIHILESEGVIVRRPDIIDFSVRTKTPFWSFPVTEMSRPVRKRSGTEPR
jgi:glycine amidinotransferase